MTEPNGPTVPAVLLTDEDERRETEAVPAFWAHALHFRLLEQLDPLSLNSGTLSADGFTSRGSCATFLPFRNVGKAFRMSESSHRRVSRSVDWAVNPSSGFPLLR